MDIPSYQSYIAPGLLSRVLDRCEVTCSGETPEHGRWELRVAPWSREEEERSEGQSRQVTSRLETPEATRFVVDLYLRCLQPLRQVLAQREADRGFIDAATRDLVFRRRDLTGVVFPHSGFDDPSGVIGLRDEQGRVVIGPLKSMQEATSPRGEPVASIPEWLRGPHVTLFGPPESAAMCINAMNALHRGLPGEPEEVARLVAGCGVKPFWGADDEDSRTPMRGPLLHAEYNLAQCFDGTLAADGGKRALMTAQGRLSLPIKRFPGLALPMTTHFVNGSPLPLHLYDFALHMFHHRTQAEALSFYVPKLENEEEAAYLRRMIASAEAMLQIPAGTVRIMVVLENPRAVFRLNEIMDQLHPYFAGASLGWHDYLASTARLFKNDPSYAIPVKSDPNIVVKHIKEAHLLLSRVVGTRGGIAIGGMYGVLPENRDWRSPSFQIVLAGYIRDVIAQFRRGLRGFWVAHPDFVRLGVALVQAHLQFLEKQDPQPLEQLLSALILDPAELQSLRAFVHASDSIAGLDRSSPNYPKALLAAELSVSDVLPNNHPEEIRYNVFQALQYLADWLAGNGCVALPAYIRGVRVRVMDDLATTERSRWEVWAEVAHGRFPLHDFLRIVQEEMYFIKHNLRTESKQVRVLWDQTTAKWYPVAAQIFTALVHPAGGRPVEFATEYLLTFTVPEVREAADPWKAANRLAPQVFQQPREVDLFNLYFHCFSSQPFAAAMAERAPIYDDEATIARLFMEDLDEDQLCQGLSFFPRLFSPADCAKHSQLSHIVAVSNAPFSHARLPEDPQIVAQIEALVAGFFAEFGCPFIFADSAMAKNGGDFIATLLSSLQSSSQQPRAKNVNFIRSQLLKQTLHKLADAISSPDAVAPSLIFSNPGYCSFSSRIQSLLQRFEVAGIAVTVFNQRPDSIQSFGYGLAKITENRLMDPLGGTWFELQSISKTIAAAFTFGWFHKNALSVDTPVNELLNNPAVCRRLSSWRLQSAPGCPSDWADRVTVRHLLEHSACGLHYCPGISPKRAGGMPPIVDLISGSLEADTGYPRILVLREPGTSFAYSGGGFMVLEHLLLSLSGHASVESLTRSFLDGCGLSEFTFDQLPGFIPDSHYAAGHADPEDPRLRGGVQSFSVGPQPFKLTTSDPRFRFVSNDNTDRLMFPGFAAGGMGTCRSLARFLQHLNAAYASLDGCGSISHDAAVQILGSADHRLRNTSTFMAEGSAMGCGVFVLCAGDNRFALHQAAGDGYRGIFVSCFHGPDAGTGFVMACNGNNNGVFLNAFASLAVLRFLDWNGVDRAATFGSSNFSLQGISQEQIVNLGYKQLLFRAFLKSTAELPFPLGPLDPLSEVNLACRCRIVSVTSDQFAPADNLLSPNVPVFHPAEFGRIGKVMDSWESSRHNPLPADVLELELQAPACLSFLSISTMFHDGNHPEQVRVEGFASGDLSGFDLVPLSPIRGHAIHRFIVPPALASVLIHTVRIHSHPDGGITRLGLFQRNSLPPEEESLYSLPKASEGIRYPFAIPPVIKRRIPKPNLRHGDSLLPYLIPNAEFDAACSEFGGTVDSVTNQHYGPADSILSVYPPGGMFDGFETARSRRRNSAEAVEISLAYPACIHRVVIDFTYFVANNPDSMAIELIHGGGSTSTLMPQTWTKPYHGNTLVYDVPKDLRTIKALRVRVYSIPCGGFNRIHFLSKVTPRAHL